MNIDNPFFKTYDTPHHTVPFQLIKLEDYEPAIREGIRREDEEIQAIIQNPEEATFENTIVALEHSGELLGRVTTVLFNLLSAETNDGLDDLANRMQPLLSEHSNDIGLNPELFARIKWVYEHHRPLNTEEQQLLENCYKGFSRRGANLNEEDKQLMRQLSMEASQLALLFRQNNLKETNAYLLHITDKTRLAGMPENELEAAAQTAQEKGLEGWCFTLHGPSYQGMMTYCADRALRQEIYMAQSTKCAHGGDTDNCQLVCQLVNLRQQMAQLLGYSTYADYALEKRMAENSENVYNLLNQLLEAYKPTAQEEVKTLEAYAQQLEGSDFQLMPWDWAYYSNLLRKEKYNLDPEMLRPYLQVDKVIEGVFALASRLYGLRFQKNEDIPVFHPDVIPYEVFDADGSFLAVLYADFYPRAGKQQGAWMTSYREQYRKDGVDHRPHVSITANFTKPTPTKPALLTLGEVETFLHEFGHALHGMFAQTTYESLGGTNVLWDFVELPSQFMENYVREKEFLHTFARHYQTDELMPDELIERIHATSNYLVGYACLRQLSFGLLDMAYYTRTQPLPEDTDIQLFEQEAWKDTQLLPTVPGCCMTPCFGHIMSGGYAAGYYSYKWAEVLDADAFSLFQQTGIFNTETATKFRRLLSQGGTVHPKLLYREFRGQEPTIDALLHRNGLK